MLGSPNPERPSAAVGGSCFSKSRTPEEFDEPSVSIPFRVFKELRSEGAEITTGCGITLAILRTPSSVEVMHRYIATLPDECDPLLSVVECYSPQVHLEVRQILTQLSSFRAQNFENRTAVLRAPDPSCPVDVAIRFHQSTFALNCVAQYLTTRSPLFPHIAALAPKSQICSIQQVWGKGKVTIQPIFASDVASPTGESQTFE